jgi:cytolysin (calcineurin-like family phosphatase)
MNRLLFVSMGVICTLAAVETPGREVTFLSTSDCHYREPDHPLGCHNDQNRFTIEAMNSITNVAWPASLGGGLVAAPRGVVVLGDCIDDGDKKVGGRVFSREQYDLFVGDFGLVGNDGLLKFPVFEGWGNHDGPPEGKEKSGFSYQANLKKRNVIRKGKGLISNLANNGLHYSWEWDDVHFVHLNFYPADSQRAGVKYSPVWHDPQAALSFLKSDLAEKVGASGRPVVLLSHCGFDTDWWTAEDWKALYEAARPYRVVLYLYGHTGTGLVQWAPAGEPAKWTCINDGQTEAGFFVIQIQGDRLRAAYRRKAGSTVVKDPGGKARREWAGKWEWQHAMEWPLRAGE